MAKGASRFHQTITNQSGCVGATRESFDGKAGEQLNGALMTSWRIDLDCKGLSMAHAFLKAKGKIETLLGAESREEKILQKTQCDQGIGEEQKLSPRGCFHQNVRDQTARRKVFHVTASNLVMVTS